MTGWGAVSLFAVAVLVLEVHSYRLDTSYGYRHWGKPACPHHCHKVRIEDGSYKCKCESRDCAPRWCHPGCQVVDDGICPSCVCDYPYKGDCGPTRTRFRHWVKPGCPSGCHKVMDHYGSFKCKCDSPDCSPKSCHPGCKIEGDGTCLRCVCDYPYKGGVPSVTGPKCRDVRLCQPNCLKVKDRNGCWICECKPVCSPPKCEPGCEIQKVFEGPCPGCECKGIDIGEPPLENICEKVECGDPCELVSQGPGECPRCVCDLKEKCDPPNCPEGCTIQQEFEGPCPGCECTREGSDQGEIDGGGDQGEIDGEGDQGEIDLGGEQDEIDLGGEQDEIDLGGDQDEIDKGGDQDEIDLGCDPPICLPGCRIQDLNDGLCPECDCTEPVTEAEEVVDEKVKLGPIYCVVPKCEPGCSLQKVLTGPCPMCECKDKKKEDDCEPPLCPFGCPLKNIERVFDGPCLRCICKEEKEARNPFGIVCDPPKCPPGCSIQEVYDGACPGCDCKEEDDGRNRFGKACDPPKCPPGCSIQEFYDGPCPGCDCEEDIIEVDPRRPACAEPPKCAHGCTLQKKYRGPCPECECPKENLKVPKCISLHVICEGPKCKLEKDENGCDNCKCQPDCGIPKCRRGCRIKEVVGGCPVCDCTKRGHWWKQKQD